MNTELPFARINGISLTQPEKNLINKLVGDYNVDFGGLADTVSNPFTGAVVTVDPVVAALIGFVQDAYSTYSDNGRMTYNGKNVAIGTFDRVRYLVSKLDSKAFMAILD